MPGGFEGSGFFEKPRGLDQDSLIELSFSELSSEGSGELSETQEEAPRRLSESERKKLGKAIDRRFLLPLRALLEGISVSDQDPVLLELEVSGITNQQDEDIASTEILSQIQETINAAVEKALENHKKPPPNLAVHVEGLGLLKTTNSNIEIQERLNLRVEKLVRDDFSIIYRISMLDSGIPKDKPEQFPSNPGQNFSSQLAQKREEKSVAANLPQPKDEWKLSAKIKGLAANLAAILSKGTLFLPAKKESQKSTEEILAEEREKILQKINKRIRELIREITKKYFYLEKRESVENQIWRNSGNFFGEALKGKPKRDAMDAAKVKEEKECNLTREQVARIHLFNKIESAASLLGIFPAVDQILEKLLKELHINILKTADLYPKEKRKEQIQHLRLQSLIASLGVILETVQGFDENIQAIYGDIIEKKSDLKQTWDKIMAVLIAGLIGNYGFHTSDICNLQVSCDHLDETQLEIAKKLGLSIEKGFISSTDYKKVLQKQSEIGEEVDWKHLLETPLLTEYLNSLEMEEARHGKDGSNRENIILIKELLLLIEKYADPLATTYARRGLDARNCNVEDLIKELPGVKKLMKKLEL